MVNNMSGRFKLSVLGGFNRRDVITYIEEIYKKINERERENMELRTQNETLEEKLKAYEEDSARIRHEKKSRVKVRRVYGSSGSTRV